MTRRNLPLVVFAVLAAAVLLAQPAAASWDNWNCNLWVRWGALDGIPADTGDYIGVQPGATDGYDLIDSKKPPEPGGGGGWPYVYSWFERPYWYYQGDHVGRIMADWRAPISEGASKRWGTGLVDTWKVKTNADNGPSGYFHPTCDLLHEWEYPVAASIYITWQFGVSDLPPHPLPPEDYAFTLIYRGGINPKPAGMKLPDAMEPPPMDTAWDMETTPYLVLPLWSESFQPWSTDCLSLGACDTPSFYISVYNPPDPTPHCMISLDPAGPQAAPATFTFAAAACCDEPFIFAWDFGDGGTATGSPVSHTYAALGIYTVTCTATDCDGDIATCAAVVEVTPCGPPVCCFSHAPAHPEVGQSVQFTDCSTSYPPCAIASWAWDFGDGAASSEQSPSHQYAAAGAYEVCLTVTDDQVQIASCCQLITVVEANLPPECSVSGLASTYRGGLVWFTATASDPEGDPLTYSWDLDGGVQSGGSGDLEVIVSWDTLGVKNVCLTVADDHGGASTCCAAIEIVNLPPACHVTVTPEPPVVGHEATFDAHPSDIDGTVASVNWDFGDGGAASGNPVGHVYAASGAYLVSATVTDNDGGVRTCQLTAQANEPPVCVLDGPATGSPGEQLCFSAAGSHDPDGGVLTYLWDMGTGSLAVPLVNPSFETAEGWTAYQGSGPPTTFPTAFCDFAPRTGSAFFGGVCCYCVTGAGIYQQVGEATVGETYTAGIWINSVSWMPGPVPTPENVHTRVGIDPLGGTDPAAPSLVWSPDFSNNNCGPGPYIKHEVAALAAAATLTVFCEYWADQAFEWEIMAMDDVTLTSGETFGSGEMQCVAYPEPGTYTVTLTVVDDEYSATHCTREVTIAGNQMPTCAITYAPADPGIDDAITFHSNSADPDGMVVSWAWDFGDGGTGSGDPAAHQYPAAGSYTVSVTVTDNEGAQRTCSTEVTVRPPNQAPVCAFTYLPSSPTTANTIQFTDASADPDGTIASWRWDFGDGSISTQRNPTHKYTSAATYTVTLTVTDNDGTLVSCSQQVTVAPSPNQPPTCYITYSPSSPWPGDPVSFDSHAADPDGMVMSVSWDFGDGGTGSGATTNHQYLAPGTYIVAVTVHDDGGAWASCTRQVVVSAPEPPSDGSDWNGNLQVYWGSPTGAPADTGDYFGSQPEATDGYDLIDSKKPGEPMGDYVFAWFERPVWGQGRIMADWRASIPEGTSKQWGPGINDTWNIKTNLDNGPSGLFDPCYGELEYPIAASVYLTWQFGVSEMGPSPLPPDDYTFTLIYRRGINPKPAGTQLPDAIAPPAVGTTWDMEATPVLVLPLWREAFQPFHADCSTFAAADVARFHILVYNPDTIPACDIAVEPPDPVVIPATFIFTATASGDPPFTFAWDFGDGGTGTGNPVSHTYATWGAYTVVCVVTDVDGDTATCTAAITQLPPPNESPDCCFSYAPSVPDDVDPVQFTDCSTDPDGVIVAWAWEFGDGGTSTDQNPTHLFAVGTYEVCLTVTDDGPYPLSATCCQATAVGHINLPPPCDITYAPANPTADDAVTFHSNAFDPDGVVVSVDWDFGDGATASGDPVGHQYAMPGAYGVTVTVCDNEGLCVTCAAEIEVGKGANLPPVCDVSRQPMDPVPGQEITFSANAWDPNPWGEIVAYEWDFGDGATASGDPAVHAYAQWATYTVCVTITDDQGGQATCCGQVVVTWPCECDLAIDRTHCKMPAAGHVGQCKTGQIGARNMSYTEPCDALLRVIDNAGNVVFETTQTIAPGCRLRVRFSHCYTASEVGRSLWKWEVFPVGCRELTPWNNVHHRRVNVHP